MQIDPVRLSPVAATGAEQVSGAAATPEVTATQPPEAAGAANGLDGTGLTVVLGAMILVLIIGRLAHSRFSSRVDDRGDISLLH